MEPALASPLTFLPTTPPPPVPPTASHPSNAPSWRATPSQAPVLVGVDADTTCCYLSSLEEHRDGDTWGVRLLEAVGRGLDPDATRGMRVGQEHVLRGVPCRTDVFML